MVASDDDDDDDDEEDQGCSTVMMNVNANWL